MKFGNFFIFTASIASLLFSAFILFGNPKLGLNFGLDLRGGSSILMKIDIDGFFSEIIENNAKEISQLLGNQFSIKEKGTKIFISTNSKSNGADFIKNKIESLIKEKFDIKKVENEFILLEINAKYANELRKNILIDSLKNIRRRIDSLGVKEISIRAQGTDKILVEVPGIDDPTDVKNIIGQTAKLSFHIVLDPSDKKNLVLSKKLTDIEGRTFFVSKHSYLDGSMLDNAYLSYSQSNNKPVINFAFNSHGAKKFAFITKENIGRMMAIVLDDKIITAPVIKESILGGRGEISGNFTTKEANEIAIMLRSGALLAPMYVLEQRTIGPTLGIESIKNGKISILFALLFVASIMIIVYKILGLISFLILFVTLSNIVCALYFLDATLTLPGIAGIVLTIGMSVDANVLIFEKIKEQIELSNYNKIQNEKKKNKIIIIESFKKAFVTITDSNLTTVIAGVAMFIFGDGPIKGFAATLCIGILSSFATSFGILRLSLLKISNWKISSKLFAK